MLLNFRLHFHKRHVAETEIGIKAVEEVHGDGERVLSGGKFTGEGPGHGDLQFLFAQPLNGIERPSVGEVRHVVAKDAAAVEIDDEAIVAGKWPRGAAYFSFVSYSCQNPAAVLSTRKSFCGSSQIGRTHV